MWNEGRDGGWEARERRRRHQISVVSTHVADSVLDCSDSVSGGDGGECGVGGDGRWDSVGMVGVICELLYMNDVDINEM